MIELIVVAFLVIWIGIAAFAFNRKQSATIAIGGGFIGAVVGLVLLGVIYDPGNLQDAQPNSSGQASGSESRKRDSSRYASDSDIISGAEQIINNSLVDPDSYERRSAKAVWRGVTSKGEPAFGAKVDYNASNALGGRIRHCEFVFFYRDAGKIMWHDKFDREPCSAVQYFIGGEPDLISALAKQMSER